MWETIVHQMLPAVLIIVFSIALFVRVLLQKHRIHQPVQWRKHRKMAIQILSISLLYLEFYFPYVLYSLMLTFGVPNDSLDNLGVYAEFCTYFMTPLLSFVCTLSLPELGTKIGKIIHFQRKPRRINSEVLRAKPMK
jgi:phosphatidylglycerophosphate synthase